MILYGAFDRHNLGDLLLAHVCAAMLPDQAPDFAGLLSRDLRRHGGHDVTALQRAVQRHAGRPLAVLHVGGEILACGAWEAAVMLLPPREVRHAVAYLDGRPGERQAWVRRTLGTSSLAPYMAPREWLPSDALVLYHGVGGVGLADRDAAMRAEVLDKLRRAEGVGVRDGRTLAQLRSAGIDARLVPDAAVMVAELFGARVARAAAHSEPARVLDAMPEGYLAVQFSADFGDDATLDTIASQLDAAAAAAGLGVVFFRAGAAPWHDDLRVLRRAAARMRLGTVAVFSSLDIWDICALVAGSRAYCGSSLHGRIVAMAFGVPRAGLRVADDARGCKQGAFAATWEPDGLMPGTVPPCGLCAAVHHALGADRARLRRAADELARRHAEAWEVSVRPALGLAARPT